MFGCDELNELFNFLWNDSQLFVMRIVEDTYLAHDCGGNSPSLVKYVSNMM